MRLLGGIAGTLGTFQSLSEGGVVLQLTDQYADREAFVNQLVVESGPSFLKDLNSEGSVQDIQGRP
jgi:hypothetical protein